MATSKQPDDITECLICRKVCTDPRVLPCVHTYCLKCIEAWSINKKPGDRLECPWSPCKREFILPDKGVGNLPKNFVITTFLHMKELSGAENKKSPCEICSGDNATGKKVATVLCVECQQKLCQSCQGYHKKFKTTAAHELLKLEEINIENLSNMLPFSNCNIHEGDQLKMYCLECKEAICLVCYIESHNSHKCSYIGKMADDFRKQMAGDVGKIATSVASCREMLESLENEKNDFTEQIEKARMEINEKAEQLKEMIDVQKQELMNDLSLKKQKRMRDIESLREEIERQLFLMESFKKYVDEVRQKATACDIARAGSGLHDRAEELLKLNVNERTLDDFGHTEVTFTSSDFATDDNIKIGQLHLVTAVQSRGPKLAHVIRCQGSARAVQALGNDVFVLRAGDEQQVEVYDARTFTLQRHITLPGLGNGSLGVATCAHHNCLYVSASDQDSVHKVRLGRKKATKKKWSVASGPAGLSVNNAHNLVVACREANKLQEYRTDGTLVREISLQHTGLNYPFHAVQLSTGDYVVSQNTSPGLIRVVGADGQVVHSYGQSQASAVGQMNYSRSLAVTKNDSILVVDSGNDRILSMSSSLGSVQELALAVDDGIQQPWDLYLDESRRRIYVSERIGRHRVLVFNYLKL